MQIKELEKRAHENAVDKGFYGNGFCPDCNNYKSCNLEYKEDSGCCDSYNADKNIGELLMLVVSELGEALEAHRHDRFCSKDRIIFYDENIDIMIKNDSEISYFNNFIKDTFEDELADAVIRIADMCGYLNIDLEKHIELKMAYNATREYKHGKKY